MAPKAIMLSKVAERVYWTARYIERVENTARLIKIYASLLLDMPKDVNLGWFNLVILNSVDPIFDERYKNRDEKNVVKFLIGDTDNPISIISSIAMIKENIRTTRDVVPSESWELVNELSLFIEENVQQGIRRKGRHEFLDGIIRGCQQLNGLLYGTMNHDAAWDFLRLGRNLERADMTTRILDAGASAASVLEDSEHTVNAKQIIWGNVLRSLGADQSYRRMLRRSVVGSDVAQYLLEDAHFPRTIQHCLSAILDSSAKLPANDLLVKHLKLKMSTIFTQVNYEELGTDFRDYINELQISLAQLHLKISDTWFNQYLK